MNINFLSSNNNLTNNINIIKSPIKTPRQNELCFSKQYTMKFDLGKLKSNNGNNKQNFSNFFSKRKFHINVKGKIFVRFIISNPLPFDLNLTDMKLIVDFSNERKEKIIFSEKNSNEDLPQSQDPLENSNRLDYELENKNINLIKFSTQKIELFVQVYKEGKINIKGVEFFLGNCAQVRHYFNKKNKYNLYKYTKKRKKSMKTKRKK